MQRVHTPATQLGQCTYLRMTRAFLPDSPFISHKTRQTVKSLRNVLGKEGLSQNLFQELLSVSAGLRVEDNRVSEPMPTTRDREEHGEVASWLCAIRCPG